MNLIKRLVIVTLSVYIVGGSLIVEPGPRYPPTVGEIWPKPKTQDKDDKYHVVRPSLFHFEKIGENSCDILTDAIKRYERIVGIQARVSRKYRVKPDTKAKSSRSSQDSSSWRSDPLFEGFLNAVKVNLKQPCEKLPYLNMEESYNLTINDAATDIESFSIWGILRGLETFTQMLTPTDDGLLRINNTYIEDEPRFPHRGLHLDTSRHYMPPFIIHQVLDGMAYNKLNVFHWHIIDDESFPYQSSVYPELSAKGAYHKSMIYTPADVQNVIEHARMRGIRVMVEIDTPGHTRSWGVSHLEILTECEGHLKGKYGPLNPTIEATYDFVNPFFEEIASVFPDKYTHIGGDEVEFECWKSNKNISKYMTDNNLATYEQLEEVYIQRVVDKFASLNQSIVVWQEVFQNGVQLPSNTVVHIWTGNQRQLLSEITGQGMPALLSACWYLDYLASGGDWIKYYDCEPTDFHGTDEQKKLVMGGEACMWAEVVDNGNVLQRIFPRVSAVAERLWSPKDVNDETEAMHRLEEHSCRMKVRGIPSQPPNGPGFCLS